MDPTATGSIIRKALIGETILNMATGAFVLSYPETVLSLIKSSASIITPTNITFTQHYGVGMILLALPPALAVPNTRGGIESRIPLYVFFGVIESCLIAACLYEAWDADYIGWISRSKLLFFAATFFSGLFWRYLVLIHHPEWIGRYLEARRNIKGR